jgi:hypothetical protein
MIGSASGFAWEFWGSAAAGSDGGLDGIWAEAVDWSAGISTAIKASSRNPLDTQRPSSHLRMQNAVPEIRDGHRYAHNRVLRMARIVLLSNGESSMIHRV